MSDKRKQSPLSEVEREKALYESYAKKQRLTERLENQHRTSIDPRKEKKSDIITPEWSQKEEKDITFDELKECIVTRDFLASNIYKPFFDFFKGAFVKVSFHNGYSICKILDIIYEKDYSYPLGKFTFLTDKYLLVKHGSNKIKIPISFVSNGNITREEFEFQRKSDFTGDIISEYGRLKKLMERILTKDEQKKFEEEKRKFMCGLGKRISYFKIDLLRKRREAILERKKDYAKELLDVVNMLEDDEKPLTSIQVNAIGRKYNLKVPGSELEKTEIVKIKER